MSKKKLEKKKGKKDNKKHKRQSKTTEHSQPEQNKPIRSCRLSTRNQRFDIVKKQSTSRSISKSQEKDKHKEKTNHKDKDKNEDQKDQDKDKDKDKKKLGSKRKRQTSFEIERLSSKGASKKSTPVKEAPKISVEDKDEVENPENTATDPATDYKMSPTKKGKFQDNGKFAENSERFSRPSDRPNLIPKDNKDTKQKTEEIETTEDHLQEVVRKKRECTIKSQESTVLLASDCSEASQGIRPTAFLNQQALQQDPNTNLILQIQKQYTLAINRLTTLLEQPTDPNALDYEKEFLDQQNLLTGDLQVVANRCIEMVEITEKLQKVHRNRRRVEAQMKHKLNCEFLNKNKPNDNDEWKIADNPEPVMQNQEEAKRKSRIRSRNTSRAEGGRGSTRDFEEFDNRDSKAEKVYTNWTQLEHDRLIEGLRAYGKDWNKVTEHVKTKNKLQINVRAHSLKIKVTKNPTSENADLVDILMGPNKNGYVTNSQVPNHHRQSCQKTEKLGWCYWSEEEQLKFNDAILSFGKNWSVVQEYIGTRSDKQIVKYAEQFIQRAEKDKKHQVKHKEILDILEGPSINNINPVGNNCPFPIVEIETECLNQPLNPEDNDHPIS